MSDLRDHVDVALLDNVTETSEVLGRGSFGEVRVIKRRGIEYAGKYFYMDRVDREKCLLECNSSFSIRHPNVVQTIGYCYSTAGKTNNIVLVMERMPFCLSHFIQFQERSVPDSITRRILHDVSKGLQHLHSANIMHRDLTANNILLTEHLTAKISDFGQAKCVDNDKHDHQTRQPGSLIYMPPEALGFVKGKEVDVIEYSTSIDIFSFGVLMIHVYLRDHPQPEGRFQALGELLRLRRPYDYFGNDISRSIPEGHELHAILKQCIRLDPLERPSASDLEQRMGVLSAKCNDSVFSKMLDAAIDYPRALGEVNTLRQQLELMKKERELEGEENRKLKDQFRSLCDMSNNFKQSQQRRSSGTKPSTGTYPTGTKHSTGINTGTKNCTGINSLSDSMVSMEDVEAVIGSGRRIGDLENSIQSLQGVRGSTPDRDESTVSKLHNAQLGTLYKEKNQLWNDNKRLMDENQALQDKLQALTNAGDDQLLESVRSNFGGVSITPRPNMVDGSPIVHPPTVALCTDAAVRDFIDNGKKLKITRTNKLNYSFARIEGAKAVLLNGEIYLGRATPTVLKYSLSTKKWSELVPAPVRNYALAEYRGELIIVGGSMVDTGVLSGDIYYYADEAWVKKDIQPLKTPRENAVAVSYIYPGNQNEYLIVLGGERHGLFRRAEILRSVEVYCSDDGTGDSRWYKDISIPRQGFNLQFVTHSEHIYLLNPDGWTIRYCSLSRLITLAINGGSMDAIWFSIDKHVPFSRCSLAVIGHALLALAGNGSDGHIYTYYPKGKPQWKKVSCVGSLPAVRNACCLELMNNELFFFGGDIDMMNQTEQAGYIISIDDGSTTGSGDISSASLTSSIGSATTTLSTSVQR